MSCGNPHETDCSEVLSMVYDFLDGEIDDAGRQQIASTWMSAGPAFASTAWSRS